MNFCPRCGTPLGPRLDGGRERPACPAEGCGFVHYGDASIGAGALVLRGDRVLLVQRRVGEREYWQIPGGYVELDEPIHSAVEREVLEEAGIPATVVDVVGFRHMAARPDRPAANLYVVFRLLAGVGDPRPDGEETFDAGFFTREEMARMPGISVESRWSLTKADLPEAPHGLRFEEAVPERRQPWYTLFGVPLP